MAINQRDAVAGAMFALTGAYFALNALFTLDLGGPLQMGPGLYPLLVGLLLTGLGVAILWQAVGAAPSPIAAFAWRSLILITLSPLVFGLVLPGLGLAPAVLASAVVASFASRRVKPLTAAAVGLGLAVFCVLLFVLGLGMPLRILGPWLVP